MSERSDIAMVVLAVVCVIAVCLIWRSCGTVATVTCPNGAEASIESRGSFESGADAEGICKELEGDKAE